MGSWEEFSPGLRTALRLYPYRSVSGSPWAPLRKPLAECRIALVSSAGLVLPEQAPFDPKVRGGDYSFRVIPRGVDVRRLVDTHRSKSFDHAGLRQDPNLAFPLDRLEELHREGIVGPPAPRHYSIMGSLTAPGRLLKISAPQIVGHMREDEVDVALLVPV